MQKMFLKRGVYNLFAYDDNEVIPEQSFRKRIGCRPCTWKVRNDDRRAA
ncbi:MAG: hypothetical protein ACP5KJ_02245 [Candidatus Micrarchaeia archaeon]